jgi:hypothetical protein
MLHARCCWCQRRLDYFIFVHVACILFIRFAFFELETRSYAPFPYSLPLGSQVDGKFSETRDPEISFTVGYSWIGIIELKLRSLPSLMVVGQHLDDEQPR